MVGRGYPQTHAMHVLWPRSLGPAGLGSFHNIQRKKTSLLFELFFIAGPGRRIEREHQGKHRPGEKRRSSTRGRWHTFPQVEEANPVQSHRTSTWRTTQQCWHHQKSRKSSFHTHEGHRAHTTQRIRTLGPPNHRARSKRPKQGRQKDR